MGISRRLAEIAEKVGVEATAAAFSGFGVFALASSAPEDAAAGAETAKFLIGETDVEGRSGPCWAQRDKQSVATAVQTKPAGRRTATAQSTC